MINFLKNRIIDKRLVIYLIGVLLIAIFLLVILLRYRIGGNTSDEEVWIQIQPQKVELNLELVGRIESASRQILSAPFEGNLDKVLFNDGEVVEAGNTLLVIDTAQLDIQIRQALAELLRAKQNMRSIENWKNGDEVSRARRSVSISELNVHDTATKLAETQQLFARGIVARMEVDALEQQRKLQENDLASSRAEFRSLLERGTIERRQIAEMDLANAQTRYDTLLDRKAKSEVKSPVRGIALKPPKIEGLGQANTIQRGQHVTQGVGLVEVASIEHVHAVTRVEESDLHLLKERMSVRITGDGFSGVILQGTVLSIGAQAIPSGTIGNSGSYDVTVDIQPLTPEQQKYLRLGMSARLNIVTYEADNSLVVPASAIRRNNLGENFVISRITMQATAQPILVKVGNAVPQGVEVFGLKPGYVQK